MFLIKIGKARKKIQMMMESIRMDSSQKISNKIKIKPVKSQKTSIMLNHGTKAAVRVKIRPSRLAIIELERP